MSTANVFHRTGENRLLATLQPEEHERLEPHMERVSLAPKDILHEADKLISHVYFPESGVVSLITILEDGTTIEVATIGNEGVIGIPVFLGANSTPSQAFSQVPGDAIKMPAEIFRQEIDRGGTLHNMVQRYTLVVFNQIAQSTACNRVHPVEQRCARWLLMTHDRAGGNEFYLTQEFLASMLGVRRATVSDVAGELQRSGLISYQRGNMTIVDRKGLEEVSCECYRIIRATFDQLFSRDEQEDESGGNTGTEEWTDEESREEDREESR